MCVCVVCVYGAAYALWHFSNIFTVRTVVAIYLLFALKVEPFLLLFHLLLLVLLATIVFSDIVWKRAFETKRERERERARLRRCVDEQQRRRSSRASSFRSPAIFCFFIKIFISFTGKRVLSLTFYTLGYIREPVWGIFTYTHLTTVVS